MLGFQKSMGALDFLHIFQMPNPDHNVQRTHRQPQLQHQQPQQQMHTKLHQPQQHALPRHEPAQPPMRDAWRNERLEHTRLHRRIISNQPYTQLSHDEPPAPDYDLPEDWDYVDDEYAEEYEAYMFQLEAKSYPIVAHMDMQPEITWDMRRVLLDFLVQVHSQCRLRPETFFLTVNIMDRYLTRRIVRRIHYQLLGMVCLWAAAKYEDVKDNVPTVHDLWFMCQSSYAEKEFVSMEAHVVHFLRFDLGYPTQEAWMKYFLAKGDGKMKPDDEPEWRGHCRWGLTPEGRKRVHNVARLIAEVACFHRQYVAWPASVLAKCALHLAVHILGLPQPSPQALQQCFPYICELEAALASASAVVLHKYSHNCLSNATEAVNSYLASGSTIKPTAAAAPPPPPPSWGLPRHHQRGTAEVRLERSRTTCGPWAAAAETTAAHAGGNLALQLLRRETFRETRPQRQQQQQQQQQQQPQHQQHYPTVQQQSHHHHHHHYLSFQQQGQAAGRRFCDLFASSSSASSSSAVFPRAAAAAAVPACGPPTPITPTMMPADPGGGNEAAFDWARAALDPAPRMAHCPAALPPPPPPPPPERAATRFPSVVGVTALYNCS